MFIQEVKKFERNFRRSIQIDKNENGFTDAYLYKHYVNLPVIFDGNPGGPPNQSLEKISGVNPEFFHDTFFVASLTPLIKTSNTLPFPFKEVTERLKSGDALGEEMMAISHFLYLSFYLNFWAISREFTVEESGLLPSPFRFPRDYEHTLGQWFEKGESPVVLTDVQKKFLRLNYTYIVSFLMDNLDF